MSKRPDENDTPDFEAGMTTAERRRRKRRGAGLRVPSDNVPRRNSGPVVAPVPEDPNLAVAIAYSFTPDASGAIPREPRESDVDSLIVDLPTGPVSSRASSAPIAPEAAATVPGMHADLEDPDGFETVTREMAKVDLEPPPTSLAALAASGVVLGPIPGGEDPSASGSMPAMLAADIVPGGVTMPMAAQSEPAWPAVTQPMAAVVPPPEAFSPEERSVEIDVGMVEEELATRAAGPVPRAETVALGDDDLAEAADAAGVVRTPGTSGGTESVPLIDADLVRDSAEHAAVAAPADVDVDVDDEDEAPQSPARRPASVMTAASPPAEPPPTRTSGPIPPVPPPVAPKAPPPAPKKPAVVRAAAVAAAAPQASSGKRGKPWFEEVFDEDYLRTLPFLTPRATQEEAQFVLDALAVAPGAQLLDVGCGYGRHAMEIAARGYHVVAFDLSVPLLLRGSDEAQRRGLTINFVQGDMRELDFDAQFDGAYCLFSTFGYFDDDANKKTAANLARALRPGARIVFEILNRDYVISDLPTRVWWEGDGCVVLEEVEFNYFSSRIQSNRSVVFDDGRQVEQEISVRAYALHEFGKLLHSAGFRVVEVSGSLHTRGRFFGSESRHLIVVAERKATREPTATGEMKVS